MAKPRLIIIIRHGQSEGNKNREIHQTVPDHNVKLTADGWEQAHDAGRRLRAMLRKDDTLHFFTSPYRRTRETTEGILRTLTSDDPDPTPFPREKIKVYEEPRLREQDFGNFQPCSAEMERMWQERADYGHFFYRIPNGESAADAYDRVSGFNESLWRQFGEDDFASVCVLVTHGLMSRVFLMKWYHFTVERFEDLRNVNHCEFLIMEKEEETGRFILQNRLRTWSELRQERDEARERKPVVRKWGGCPQGCSHSRHFKRRDDLEMLRLHDERLAAASVSSVAQGYSSDDELEQRTRANTDSSPDGTPSFIPRALSKTSSKVHHGRDGGGSYSGHGSAEDDSDSAAARAAAASSKLRVVVSADRRLGDGISEMGSDWSDDLEKQEKENRSLRGSVY